MSERNTRFEVEPFGYRRWACFLYQGESDKPVWGVFGIKTSSERVAREKCQEMYATLRGTVDDQ